MSRGMVIGSSGAPMEIGEITLDNKSDQVGNGFLLCDGSNINQNQYPELYNIFKESNLNNWQKVNASFPSGITILGLLKVGERWILEDDDARIWTSDSGFTNFVNRGYLNGIGSVSNYSYFQGANTLYEKDGIIYALAGLWIFKSEDNGLNFEIFSKVFNTDTSNLQLLKFRIYNGYYVVCSLYNNDTNNCCFHYSTDLVNWTHINPPSNDRESSQIYYDEDLNVWYLLTRFQSGGFYRHVGSVPNFTEYSLINGYGQTQDAYIDNNNKIGVISTINYLYSQYLNTTNTSLVRRLSIYDGNEQQISGGNSGYVLWNSWRGGYISNDGINWIENSSILSSGLTIYFSYYDENNNEYYIMGSNSNVASPSTTFSQVPNYGVPAYIKSGLPQS